MRARCLDIILLLLVSATATAQGVIDSLESELKTDLSDTSRIAALIRLSNEYQYTDIDRSRELAEQALRIAENNRHTKAKIRAYQTIGALYALSGDYSSALRYDNLALQTSLENRDSA